MNLLIFIYIGFRPKSKFTFGISIPSKEDVEQKLAPPISTYSLYEKAFDPNE